MNREIRDRVSRIRRELALVAPEDVEGEEAVQREMVLSELKAAQQRRDVLADRTG